MTMVDTSGTVSLMSDRDRVAQAICKRKNDILAKAGVVIDDYEDHAEYYLELADAAIEAMGIPAKAGDDIAAILDHKSTTIERIPAANDVLYAPVESTKRGTRLAPDWQPSDRVQAELAHRYPHLNFPLLLDEFRDYWCAVPGQRGLKLSWDRTFRNSVRERAHKPQYRLATMSKVDSKANSYLDD